MSTPSYRNRVQGPTARKPMSALLCPPPLFRQHRQLGDTATTTPTPPGLAKGSLRHNFYHQHQHQRVVVEKAPPRAVE